MIKIKSWELTPSILRIFANQAELSKKQKKHIMSLLADAALDGKTNTTIYFYENDGECILAKKYLQSLGYGIIKHPLNRALIVSWKENGENAKF